MRTIATATGDFNAADVHAPRRHGLLLADGVSALYAGLHRRKIPAQLYDGSFALVSRGILDGKPVEFDFTVDSVHYRGSHAGMLAVRNGKVVVATAGYKLQKE